MEEPTSRSNGTTGANGTPDTKRRQFTPEDKATMLRRHLADQVPVSDLCDEYHIPPSLFYVWQRQAPDNLGWALQDGRTRARRSGPAGSATGSPPSEGHSSLMILRS